MLKNNQLPAFRVGSDWRFTVEAIDKWRAGVESGAPVPASENQPNSKYVASFNALGASNKQDILNFLLSL